MIPVIDEWCRLHASLSTGRRGTLMAQHPEWFAVIMLYGTEDGWDELKRRQDSPNSISIRRLIGGFGA
jgi:uncharacterized protein